MNMKHGGEKVQHVLVSPDGKIAWVIAETWFGKIGESFGPTLERRAKWKNPLRGTGSGTGPCKDLPIMTNGRARPATPAEILFVQKILHSTGFEFN